MPKIGVIGAGMMGGALIRGVLAAGLYTPQEIIVQGRTPTRSREDASRYGVRAAASLADVTQCDTAIMAVKPAVAPTILQALAAQRYMGILVSVVTGCTLAEMKAALPQATCVRAMPNTPLAVGAGFTAIAADAPAEITTQVQEMFAAMGEAVVVDEMTLERLGALAGAGPGYAFVILDALADAGVRIGLPRPLALAAAAQTLGGAARMQQETGLHPAVLRDQVTSPGGTTIAGIAAMEHEGVRTALGEAVLAAYRRGAELRDRHE